MDDVVSDLEKLIMDAARKDVGEEYATRAVRALRGVADRLERRDVLMDAVYSIGSYRNFVLRLIRAEADAISDTIMNNA